MAAGPNPLVSLGTLNRLRGTLIFPDHPELNVSAAYLGREGIRLAVEGDSTEMLPQMAGMVTSQNVYLKATISVALIKTQPLAALFKARMEFSSVLGGCTFRSDASNLPPYEFVNCAIENMEGIDASGSNAAFPLRIAGTYYINSDLWNL